MPQPLHFHFPSSPVGIGDPPQVHSRTRRTPACRSYGNVFPFQSFAWAWARGAAGQHAPFSEVSLRAAAAISWATAMGSHSMPIEGICTAQ